MSKRCPGLFRGEEGAGRKGDKPGDLLEQCFDVESEGTDDKGFSDGSKTVDERLQAWLSTSS